jgi:hypothetical protein
MTTIRIDRLIRRNQTWEGGGGITASHGWRLSEGWSWYAIGSRWRTNHDGEGLWRYGLDSSTGVYSFHQVLGTGQFSIRSGSQAPANVRARIRRRFAQYEEITP